MVSGTCASHEESYSREDHYGEGEPPCQAGAEESCKAYGEGQGIYRGGFEGGDYLDYALDETEPQGDVEGHRDGQDDEGEAEELFHGVFPFLSRL